MTHNNLEQFVNEIILHDTSLPIVILAQHSVVTVLQGQALPKQPPSSRRTEIVLAEKPHRLAPSFEELG